MVDELETCRCQRRHEINSSTLMRTKRSRSFFFAFVRTGEGQSNRNSIRLRSQTFQYATGRATKSKPVRVPHCPISVFSLLASPQSFAVGQFNCTLIGAIESLIDVNYRSKCQIKISHENSMKHQIMVDSRRQIVSFLA